MIKIDLNGEYRLYTYNYQAAPEYPEQLEGVYIYATVPGNVELDYQAAGKLQEVLFAVNAKNASELEWKDFWYTREFYMDELPEGEVWIHFDGVDTIAD